MSWVELSLSSLKRRLSSQELEALTDESPDADQKIEELLTQVAQEVVSRVNSGRRKRALPSLQDTEKRVPPGSQQHAYTLVRRLLTDTFPSLAEFNGDDRRQAVDEAEAFLDDLANNNADSDDDGAIAFENPIGGASFRYSGNKNCDYTSF